MKTREAKSEKRLMDGRAPPQTHHSAAPIRVFPRSFPAFSFGAGAHSTAMIGSLNHLQKPRSHVRWIVGAGCASGFDAPRMAVLLFLPTTSTDG